MLKLFKTYYLKKHVIDLSYRLPKVLVEMTKAPIDDHEESLALIDAKCYYEAVFVSHIVQKWKIDETNFTKFERERYNQGVKQLADFASLKDFIEGLALFNREAHSLYINCQREYTTANIWARRETTTHIYEKDVEQTLENYIKLMKDTENYPDWNEKIKNEIGYYIHMIHSSLVSDKNFETLFAKFDKQYFFK